MVDAGFACKLLLCLMDVERGNILDRWMSQILTAKWEMHTKPLNDTDLDWICENPE